MKVVLKIIALCLLFSACSSQRSSAQIGLNNKAQELFDKASEDKVFGRIELALAGFKEALKLNPNFERAHIEVASIYFNYYKEYAKALGHYETLMKLNPSWYQSYYYAANCCLALKNFDEATSYATKYLTEADLSERYKQELALLLKSIDFSKNAYQHPVDFNPINLGPNVNTNQAEYFPSVTADNEWLYFTFRDESGRYPNEDIYSSKNVDGVWQKRERLNLVNTYEDQEGAHCITQDGRYLFFASDRKSSNAGKFDIYIAKKLGDEWKAPANVGNIVNTYNWESQPVISADSRSLFFVRANNEGFGGSDIYVSRIGADGKFSKAENLGPVINTIGDEQRPYIHPDGKTLYFASNGHVGMGNGDIFKSTLQEDGTWSKPENLGYPINTFENEMGLFVSADGLTAFFASDREGGFGDVDIYSFELPLSARPEKVVNVKGLVLDKASAKPIKADIKIVNLETGEVYKTLSSDPINGAFLITLPAGNNFAYQTNAEAYLPYSENFSLSESSASNQFELVVELQKLVQGEEFVLRNIFFEPNQFELKNSSKVELNLLVDYLNKYPELRLEVGGHTDDVGAESFNLLLSENRAKSVYTYLVQKGLAESRLSYKGYGEAFPLFPNNSEEHRAKNRRTAFKVL